MATTPDGIVVTGPNFEQVSIGGMYITPTGGTQAKLADALAGTGESPSFTAVTAGSLTVTGNITGDATHIGLFGATKATQPTAAAQAAIVDGSIGSANATTGVDALVGSQTILVPLSMASLANSQQFQIDTGFAGKLLSINYRNTVAVTTGGKAATVQAQVNGSSVTGGVISLSGTYAVGAAQAGTAITAGTQTFTSGQTIGFLISSVTTFSEGSGVVELTLINTDTANAISTLIAQTNAIRAGLVTLGAIKGS